MGPSAPPEMKMAILGSAINGTGAPERRRDDQRLAQQAGAGDRSALRRVADRLLDRVRTTVRYVSADDRDQDDWVQLAMIEILRYIGSYHGGGSLESWADRITIRTALRHLKQRRKRERTLVVDSDARQRLPDNLGEMEQRLVLRRHLARHFDKLSPERRVAVTLRLVHGYAVDEIAELTGAPRNTVRDRLAQGRKQLRQKISNDPVLRDWAGSGME